MQPVKRGPPSPSSLEKEEPLTVAEQASQAKKAKEEQEELLQASLSLETNLHVRNGIIQPLPHLNFVHRPKEPCRDLVKFLVHNPQMIETFESFLFLSTTQAAQRAVEVENRTDLHACSAIIKQSEPAIMDLLSECQHQLQSNNEDWQLQIAITDSLLETELSVPAKALFSFVTHITTLILLKAALPNPFIEQDHALDILRYVVKQSLFDAQDIVINACKTLPEPFLNHLVTNANKVQLHVRKRELVLRLSTLPRDYLIGIASGLMLLGADKKSFEVFSKQFAIHSSSLITELHTFIVAQNGQTQCLLLDLFLEEIEDMLQNKIHMGTNTQKSYEY